MKRTSRIIVLLLAVCAFALVSGLALAGSSGTCGDGVSYTLTDDGVLTVSGGGTWDSAAFGQRPDILNIIIEDGVTEIGWAAFEWCENLGSVTIPDTVTQIQYYAFSNCRNLSSIHIPGSVTSLGNEVFNGCDSLSEISFGGTVEEWNSLLAQSSNKKLDYSTVTCSDGTVGPATGTLDENGVLTVSGAGKYAANFDYETRQKVTKIVIGANVTYFETVDFYNFDNLTEFEVDSSNPFYASQDGLLYNKDQTTLIRVPGGLQGALTLSSGITTVESRAFSYCMKLTSVVLPEGVTELGYGAFWNCTTLEGLTLPSSLNKVGSESFFFNLALHHVNYAGTVADWETIEIGYGNRLLCLSSIHCTDGDVPIAGSIGEEINYTLTPEGVLTVTGAGNWDSEAFKYSSTIQSVVLENGVTEIGQEAFSGCSHLASAIIPDSVEAIRTRAFSTCENLQSIRIPGNVTEMGDEVFNWCYTLTEVTFGGTVEDWQALVGETNNPKLDELSITCSDGTVEPKPKTGTIGEGVSYTLTLDGLMTVTGAGEWYSWPLNYDIRSKIISIILESGVTEIGEGAFAWCSNLSQIFIPDTVTEIKYEAFYGCNSLASVTIPGSVKTIGNEAFDGCEILEEIRFDGTKAQWQALVNGTINEIFSECIIKCTDGDVVGTKEGEGDGFTWILAGDELTINGTSFDGYNLDYDIVRKAKKVTISTTINQLNNLHALENAININAEEGNENFRSVDGVLFTHDLKTLYAFPTGRTGTYTVPEGTTALGESAFDVSKIDELILPSTLQRIEARALNALRNITEITIPASVTYIDEEYGSNFSNCDSLVNILVEEENDTYYDQNGILYQKNGDILLKYAAGRKEKNVTIDAGAVAAYAFQGNQGLESVIFAPGIERIGAEAFFYSGITTVTLPASLQMIEYRVFYGCPLSDVTYTGTMAEWNNVEIDSSVYQLFLMDIRCADGTLYQQEMSGSLGEGITYTLTSDGLLNVYGAGSWEDRPFQNNEYVKRVILDSDVTEIGMLAFLGCANLKSIEIPKTVTSIGNSALSACNNLTDIYYEGSAEEWDTISVGFNNEILNNVNKFFYWNGWKKLSNILTLPKMLTTIESEAFAGLTNVDAVRISGNVTEIADDAFAGTDLVILAPAGSYAEEWAGEHGIPCRND